MASGIKPEEPASSCALTVSFIDVGPGYRVYYARHGDRLLLLLAGGNKSTQSSDIAKALELNRQFLEDRQ
jgi:hypothetical protein